MQKVREGAHAMLRDDAAPVQMCCCALHAQAARALCREVFEILKNLKVGQKE